MTQDGTVCSFVDTDDSNKHYTEISCFHRKIISFFIFYRIEKLVFLRFFNSPSKIKSSLLTVHAVFVMSFWKLVQWE